MAKYGYIATIGADTNGLTKALRQIDDETRKTNTELREINKALKLDPTNAELLAQKYELLSKKLESAKVKAESLEEVQVKMAKGVANHKAFENAYEPLKKELDEVIKKVKDAEKAAKTADERFRNTEITYDKYKEYRDALVATQKEQAAVEAKITDLEKKFDSSGGRIPEEEYRRYRRELEQTRISASQLEKETRELDNATEQSSKAVQEQAEAFNKIETSLKSYNNALSINESELKKVTAQYSDNAESVEALAAKQKLYEESISAQKQKIAVLNTALAESKKYYGESSDETLKWQKAIVDSETNLIKTKKNLDSVNNSLKEQNSALDKVEDQSSKAFRKAVESTKEYQQAMDRLNSSAGELKSKVGGALNDIWNITLKAATAITSTAVAAGAASVKIGSDFDKSMSTVQALSGAAGAELDTLREKAKEMGATTSKTAKESADALGYMALAGWDTQQMLGGLEPILRASEAGAMDLATTSDLVTDSMSAMGVSVNDLTHYLDVATKAQSSSNTSLEQLLNAYVIAGGSFKNFNVSLEESATLLGILANRGIKGSEAGNSLNSVLINLIGASGKSSEAMETLGVSAFDTNGKFIGVTETLEQVSTALEKLDEEQRAVLTAQLGGKTQYDTLQALLSGVNEEYDVLLGKIEDSNGALEDTAKIMRDNLRGDIDSLKSKLQDLGIEVNDQFTESFREAVQVTTKEVSKLSDKISISDGELGESLEKIGNAFAKVLEQIAKFATNTGIPAAINFFEFIADHGELVKGVIVGIGSAFIAWKFSNIITGLNGIHTSFMKLKISAQESATAMQAYNNIIKTNIYAAVASALIGMATALKTWLDTHSEIKNLVDETSQAIYNQTDAYNKSVRAAEENSQKAEQNAAAARNYWYEIQKLVDEQGNARGSADELNTAVARFNQIAGTNIEVINGQIQGYKDLTSTMSDYIEQTKREAQMSFLQDSYGEALLNIDETTKKYEEALEKRENLFKEYNEKQKWLNEANQTGYSEHMPYEQLILQTEELKEQFSAAYTESVALEEQVNSYQSVIDKFEGLFDYGKTKDNNGARIAAEGMAAEYAEEAKNAANKIEEEQKKIVNNLQKKMENLEYKKNTHQFADDTEYWSERRRVLNENINKDSAEWWKYYDETEKFFADLTEEQKEAYEQQIENQAEALKERKELNDDFTDEMYYDELETIITALDKESDLYKKYNSEILKGRKELADDLDDEAVKSAKEQAEAVTSQFEKAYAEIKSKREQLLNDFRNIELTETVKDKNGKDMLILKDLDAEIKRLDKYEASLAKLRATGISESLMAEINKLDYSSGERQDYINTLLSIPADKLQQYYKDWDKLQARQESAANLAVEEELNETNKKAQAAVDSVTDMFNNMTKTAYEKGAETAKSFYQGMIDNMDGLNDTKTINAVFRAGYTDDSIKSAKANNAVGAVGNFISVKTPITIIVDGVKHEKTIEQLIDEGIRSSGNPFHL